MYHKMILAILSMVSNLVFAGEMAQACVHGDLTTPCDSTYWEFGGKALYVQTAGGGLSGDRTFSNNLTKSIASAGQYTSWNLGFMIEANYHFHTGNDVDLNWYHFGHTTTTIRQGEGIFTPNDLNLSDLTGTLEVDSSVNQESPRWDAINLEFGQTVNYDKNRSIRIHAGLAFARLDNNLNSNLGVLNVPKIGSSAQVNIRQTVRGSFNGMGPRLGADLNYAFGDSLAVYADGAVALFLGSSKYSNTNERQLLTIGGTTTMAIPGLEAKLGATYAFPMAGGTMKFDVGWLWDVYVGAMSIPNSSILYGPTYNNFSVESPYLGLRWFGNIG